jgi:alpha-1,3-fucosyltransferase
MPITQNINNWYCICSFNFFSNSKYPSMPESGDCRAFIAESYKFFFAIENSICSGYITEKFFDTLKLDIVPVVLGQVGHDAWIPRSGYINAADFAGPEDLGKYLSHLGADKIAYNKFFEWKRYVVRLSA